jgi:hypothetical protein
MNAKEKIKGWLKRNALILLIRLGLIYMTAFLLIYVYGNTYIPANLMIALTNIEVVIGFAISFILLSVGVSVIAYYLIIVIKGKRYLKKVVE